MLFKIILGNNNSSKPFLLRVILLCYFLLMQGNIFAQLYLGVTNDFGNRVSMQPDPGVLLKSPNTPSASLKLVIKEKIGGNWYLQYGAAIGSLGYRLKILDQLDSASLRSGERSYFTQADFNTIYLNASLLVGKQISIKKKHVGLYLGGGITHYWEYSLQYTARACDANTCDLTFKYDLRNADRSGKGFIEFSAQTDINKWLILGLRYKYHFNPALTGRYHFYHLSNPSSGTLSITQKELSLLFLVRIPTRSRD
jgi:hypothetical protein